MAEFLRSKCLDVLFDQLLSSDLLKFAHREGIREELDKWRKTMERIREVLDDAEEQQRTKKTVKDWLDDLRDLFYDMEDLLDEFATEALDERKLMAGESQASASMVLLMKRLRHPNVVLFMGAVTRPPNLSIVT